MPSGETRVRYSQQGQEVRRDQSHHLFQANPVKKYIPCQSDWSIYGDQWAGRKENVLTLRPWRPTRPFSPGFPGSPCWEEIGVTEKLSNLELHPQSQHGRWDCGSKNSHWLLWVQGIPSLLAVHGLPEDQVDPGDHHHQQHPVRAAQNPRH